MKSIVKHLSNFHADESGAAFIEYTALLGVILAVGIGILVAVGAWAGGVWNALCSTLGSATTSSLGIGCTPPA